MSDGWKLVLSLIAAAIIAGGGAFGGVATDLGPNQDIGDIRTVTWVVIIVTAVVAAAKDLESYVRVKKRAPKGS
jgi:hypothetical protein